MAARASPLSMQSKYPNSGSKSLVDEIEAPQTSEFVGNNSIDLDLATVGEVAVVDDDDGALMDGGAEAPVVEAPVDEATVVDDVDDALVDGGADATVDDDAPFDDDVDDDFLIILDSSTSTSVGGREVDFFKSSCEQFACVFPLPLDPVGAS